MRLTSRRVISVAAAVVAASLTPLATAPAAQADHRVSRPTQYGFAGAGFGSRALAEQAGLRSDRTAWVSLACTRRTGVHRRNFVAQAGGGTGALLVEGVTNTSRSYRTRTRLVTRTVSSVSRVVLGDPEGQHLEINGLRTDSRAFVRRSDGTLGATSRTRSRSFTAATGTGLDEVLNQVDGGLEDALAQFPDPLIIPGFGEISSGAHRTRVARRSALARGAGFDVLLYGADAESTADDVRVQLARTGAKIFAEVPAGVMRGRAVSLQSVLAGGLVNVGRANNHPLACPGTRGEIRHKRSLGANLGNADLIKVQGLKTRVYGIQRDRGSARAWTEAGITNVELGEGRVQIRGIVGRANVRTDRRGRIVTRNARGSTIGGLKIDGEEHALPKPGEVVEVPDLATLQFFTRDVGRRGLRVTAVRVTLLPGTPGESVVDLGQARAYITRG